MKNNYSGQKLLSIIIPIYNVETFLRCCLDSVLKNILDSKAPELYEIILVDDGSTDNSGIICDDYAKAHSFISVIHKKNEGLGYARNSGIEIAKGEYLFFIDSDDYITDGTISYLEQMIKTYQADVISFKFKETNIENDSVPQKASYDEVLLLNQHDIIKNYLIDEILTTAWGSIYKRKIFETELFTNVPMCEDTYSMHLFLSKANNVLMSKRICYMHRFRNESIMNSKFNDNFFILEECGKRLINFVETKPELKDLHDYAVSRCIKLQMYLITCICQSGQIKMYKPQIRKIRKDIIKESHQTKQKKKLYNRRFILLLFGTDMFLCYHKAAKMYHRIFKGK